MSFHDPFTAPRRARPDPHPQLRRPGSEICVHSLLARWIGEDRDGAALKTVMARLNPTRTRRQIQD